MKFEKFIENTRRTWNKQDAKTDFQHALLGLIDESGELASAVKKKVGYGQELNLTNIKEEIGDYSYFLARVIDQLQFNPILLKKLIISIDEVIKTKLSKDSKITMFDNCRYISIYTTNILLATESEDDEKAIAIIFNNTIRVIQIFNSICFDMNIKYNSILNANIAKLKARFPEKFDSSLAKEENRDRKKEAHEINKKV